MPHLPEPGSDLFLILVIGEGDCGIWNKERPDFFSAQEIPDVVFGIIKVCLSGVG